MPVTLHFSGQIHNLKALHKTLGLVADSALNPIAETSRVVLAAWRQWGTATPEHLIGDFALVIEDHESHSTFLARSPFGVKPLYYRLVNRTLYHAFNAVDLKKKCPLAFTPDPEWIARFLTEISADHRKTAYRELFKVAPSHCLLINAEGQMREWRYHHWQDDAPYATRRDARWVEAYQQVLEEAIRCRMDSHAPMGTENSGGIDSGTITAYLCDFLGEPDRQLHGFSYTLFAHEPALIFATSLSKGIYLNHVISAQPTHDRIDQFVDEGIRHFGYPHENSLSTYLLPMFQECQFHGIRTLFSGFGGDEAATHGAHLVRHEFADTGNYRGLWDVLPGNPLTRAARFAKALGTRRQVATHRADYHIEWEARWQQRIVRDDVLTQQGLYEGYIATARRDAPYRSVNHYLIDHLLDKAHIDSRGEACTVMAAAFGVNYQWPLLDTRLVQQYLSTPSIEKCGPKGLGRYLHRRAIEAVVPHEITWNPSKALTGKPFARQAPAKQVPQLLALAQREVANLHPALEPLIDRTRLQQHLEVAAHARSEGTLAYCLENHAQRLRWLNRWLHAE